MWRLLEWPSWKSCRWCTGPRLYQRCLVGSHGRNPTWFWCHDTVISGCAWTFVPKIDVWGLLWEISRLLRKWEELDYKNVLRDFLTRGLRISICDAVQCPGDKSPRLDGLRYEFYKYTRLVLEHIFSGLHKLAAEWENSQTCEPRSNDINQEGQQECLRVYIRP